MERPTTTDMTDVADAHDRIQAAAVTYDDMFDACAADVRQLGRMLKRAADLHERMSTRFAKASGNA